MVLIIIPMQAQSQVLFFGVPDDLQDAHDLLVNTKVMIITYVIHAIWSSLLTVREY